MLVFLLIIAPLYHQDCLNHVGNESTNTNERIIRIVKIFRILRIARILKLTRLLV